MKGKNHKERIERVVKEFAVLEHLIQGYERENARLTDDMKQQKTLFAEREKSIETQNVALQRQVSYKCVNFTTKTIILGLIFIHFL